MIDTITVKALGVEIECESYGPARASSSKSKVKVLGESHKKTEKQIACIVQEFWKPGDVILIERPKGRVSHIFYGRYLKSNYLPGNIQKFYGWDDGHARAKQRIIFKKLRILTGLMLDLKKSSGNDQHACGKNLVKYIESNHLLEIDEKSDSSMPTVRQLLERGDLSALTRLGQKALDKMKQVNAEAFGKRNHSMAQTIEKFRRKKGIGTIFVIAGSGHVRPAQESGKEEASKESQAYKEAQRKGVNELITYLNESVVDYEILCPVDSFKRPGQSPFYSISYGMESSLKEKKQLLDSTLWKVARYVILFFSNLFYVALFPITVPRSIYKQYKADTSLSEVLAGVWGTKINNLIEERFPFIKRSHPELSSDKIWSIEKELWSFSGQERIHTPTAA